MTTRQIDWLIENREAAASALAALASEPLSRSERQRLRRLVNVLEENVGTDAGPQDRATLARRLSSGEFSWLPASPIAETNLSDSEHEVPVATTSQNLVLAARSVQPLRYDRLDLRLIYPLILLGFAWIVLVGLSLIVSPTFQAMFDMFGLALPLPTRLLFGLSQFIASGGWLWVPVVVCVALSVWMFLRRRARLDSLSLKYGLRQRGGTSELVAMSCFCRALADAIKANAPVAEALRWAGSNCGHVYYEQAASLLADEAQQSDSSLATIPSARLFPANLLQALESGRQPAQRINVALLLTLADIYEERASERGENGSTLLGIFAVVGVGCSVGFAAIALFMPLVQLISGLS